MGEIIANVLVLIACYPPARFLVRHEANRRAGMAAINYELEKEAMTDETPWDDANSKLVGMVHHVISSSNEIVAACDKLLEQDGRDFFAVPRETMRQFREVLATSSMMAGKMFEENQRIMDLVEKSTEKAKKENPT